MTVMMTIRTVMRVKAITPMMQMTKIIPLNTMMTTIIITTIIYNYPPKGR